MMTIDAPLLWSALLSVLLVTACDGADDPQSELLDRAAAEQTETENMTETMTLELALPEDTAPAVVEAIAKSAEALAGDEVSGAKVMAEKRDDGPMLLKIELWGAALDDEAEVLAALRERHPIVAKTPVALERRAGPPKDADPLEVGADFPEDASAAEIEAIVARRLAAQGVTGDVTVDVGEDADGHRRVEVRVEETKQVDEDGE